MVYLNWVIKMKKKVLLCFAILYLMYVCLYYYITLPPLNWHSIEFYFFLGLTLGPLLLMALCYYGAKLGYGKIKDKFSDVIDTTSSAKKHKLIFKACIIALVLIVGVPLVSMVVCSPLFNASEYATRIEMKDVSFSEIPEVDFKTTPIIDRDSSIRLGDKVMGNMTEWVSQFEVSEEYTQISYHGSVARVTPLTYNGIIKYFKNRGEGIPAYIMVDNTNGETTLVKLKDLNLDGMRYVPSAMFNENLYRHLRFNYPFAIFGEPSFEVDEDGHPWYICTTYSYKGVQQKKYVTGAIFLDPITGESTHYDLGNIPSWADRVFPESLVVEEVDDQGLYQNGYLNSIFGQTGVIVTSEGYNYLEKDGDIWLYSGITSANSDESNVGFVLVNLRTHEAMQIKTAGANENSAMLSAQAEVKNYGYTSTFPLLTNIKGNPVYLMSLKDNGIIKMYAMVSAIDYQKVAVVTSEEGLVALEKKMINVLGNSDDIIIDDSLTSKTIEVEDIEIVYHDGNTIYYLKTSENEIFKVNFSIGLEDKLVFIEKGSKLEIEYLDTQGIKTIKKIK